MKLEMLMVSCAPVEIVCRLVILKRLEELVLSLKLTLEKLLEAMLCSPTMVLISYKGE